MLTMFSRKMKMKKRKWKTIYLKDSRHRMVEAFWAMHTIAFTMELNQ